MSYQLKKCYHCGKRRKKVHYGQLYDHTWELWAVKVVCHKCFKGGNKNNEKN